MDLIQGRYPIEYRSEIVQPVMTAVRQGESVCVVGMAGVGKSNLVHFLEQPETRTRYLPESTAGRTHFVSLSCWQGGRPKEDIFAALLTLLWLIASRQGYDLTRTAPLGAAPYLMLRNVLRDLCGAHGQRLVFVLDEFEGLIQHQPEDFFDDLCALRDDYRSSGQLTFVTITHRMPQLVPGQTVFGRTKFFALLRDHLYPLQPYGPRDADNMLNDLLAKTEGLEIAPEYRQRLIAVSGGHCGLLKAIFTATASNAEASGPKLLRLAGSDERVREVCDQIWIHLHHQEQEALRAVGRKQDLPQDLTSYLQRRGLLRKGTPPGFFSPLFGEYVVRRQLEV